MKAPELVVYHHDGVSRVTFETGRPLVLGRGEDADFAFRGSNLSRRHAEFKLEDGVVWIHDLESSNGTHVNGQPITTPTPISSDDEIRLGSVVVAIATRADFDAAKFGLASHELFMAAARAEVIRTRTFKRSMAVLLVAAEDNPTEWIPRVPALVRDVDTVAFNDPIVEVVLAEASDTEAARLARTLAMDGIRCAVAAYPTAGRSAEALLSAARNALETADPVGIAGGESGAAPPTDGPVIRSPVMTELYRTAERVAVASIPILLLGETGTGKEVLAREIHARSHRQNKPMHSINCGAIPQTLIESVLFGHEKGAFTGADRQSVGVFQSANGGTILLDEIGELPLAAQVTLLRVLDNKTMQRVGSPREMQVDVRVLASTNRDLEAMCAKGTFRLDLLYRINTMTLRIPPLRERLAEVQALAHHFIDRANREYDREVVGILPSALSFLLQYPWPGNIRELRNVMDRAVLICVGSHIAAEDLPERIRGLNATATVESTARDPIPSAQPTILPAARRLAPQTAPRDAPRASRPSALFKQTIAACEEAIIRESLRRNGGNQTRTATQLGIARRTLVYKIRSHGIRGEPDPELAATLASRTEPGDEKLSLKDRIGAIESRAISQAIERTHGNHTAAARLLGLQRRTFDNKARKYDLVD